MLRTLIVMALLASLFYIVQHWQPVAEPTVDKVAATKAAKPADEAAGQTPSGFNPVVPEALPDVEKGYLFSEKRKIEKDAPPVAVKPEVIEPGPEVLDSVVYVGSVIIGDIRRALVTYQEPPKDVGPAGPAGPAGARRPVGRRPGGPEAAAAQSAPLNKQIAQGDRLLGFVLTQVEPTRLVFEKGGQKVEKFLYDRNKKRIAAVTGRAETPPQSIVSPAGVPLEAFVPPDVAAQVAASPEATKRYMSGGGVIMPPPPGVGGDANAGLGGSPAATQSGRMVRRSQRLLGDSSFKIPISPIPGLPVPKN